MKLERREAPALAAAILIPLLSGVLGGIATSRSVRTWYKGLRKPRWNPPAQLFAPVWTLLYLLMGIASYLVWREGDERPDVKTALAAYGAQLGLNIGWSFIFFGAHRVDLALAEIGLLWAALATTIGAFLRVSRPAALLMLPYQLWVTFASALNAAIWRLNR